MKKAILLCCFVPVWVIGVWAKAPTVRIVVSLPGRPSLEITDPEVLALSNAWGGEFIDTSMAPLTSEPPLLSYEVSLYAKFAENDIRKVYVFFFYPASSGGSPCPPRQSAALCAAAGSGFIYLPGHGPMHVLNSGTILREGLDGKWCYASRAWTALVHPLLLIAQLNAIRAHVRDEGVQARDAARAWQVRTNRWTTPRAGWLYVLDPRSEAGHPGSRIWLVAPGSRRTMGSISAGYAPDMALSPDGKTLYVVSGERESGEIAVIDTAGGAVRHIPFPERVLYVPWYAGLLPAFSQMKVSGDGRVLAVLNSRHFAPGPRLPEEVLCEPRLFDLRSSQAFPVTQGLGECEYGRFLAGAPESGFRVLSPGRLQDVEFTAAPYRLILHPTRLPSEQGCAFAQGFERAAGKVALVRSDATLLEISKPGEMPQEPGAPESCGNPRFVPGDWPLSADRENIYLGYGEMAEDGMSRATEVRRFETRSWQPNGSLRTSQPFWSLAISGDGKKLYATVPARRQVLVINALTLKQIGVIPVGRTPVMVIVAH